MLDWLSDDGIDSRRETTGCSSQSGSGRESRSVFLTRSEGHVWSRRCVSCRHRALGAVSTLGGVWLEVTRGEEQGSGTLVEIPCARWLAPRPR